ncbi:MAG TPA: septum site-determining protein MinC, partial [Deinococcales bacterium]|nr:septum site-determining protein MinC [Deinococcales bacterium]
KIRGTRGGVLLTVHREDTKENLDAALRSNPEAVKGNVILELPDRTGWPVVEQAVRTVEELGGTVTEVRPVGAQAAPRGETKIIGRTIRSGGKVESTGSIVVIGDVNAGAELVAADDIIILGTLRGVAHAGAAGNEKAVIWAQQIRSPQLRIGGALAQAGAEHGAEGPEVALLRDGSITVRPWT